MEGPMTNRRMLNNENLKKKKKKLFVYPLREQLEKYFLLEDLGWVGISNNIKVYFSTIQIVTDPNKKKSILLV